MHQHREPPREARGLPDARQRARRILVKQGFTAATQVLDDRLEQHAHIRGREVQSLGAGRRHDVCRVADQEQSAKTHRLGDEAAQRSDALLDRGAGHQSRGILFRQAQA